MKMTKRLLSAALSLCLAACLSRGRLRMGRAILASALGAGYAALAWSGPGWARGIPALLGAALLMAGVAFGPRCLRVTPLVFAAGWLLGGCADFLCIEVGCIAAYDTGYLCATFLERFINGLEHHPHLTNQRLACQEVEHEDG